MDRRRFLTAVTAAVGGFALDPERPLWAADRPRLRAYWEEAYAEHRILAVEVAYTSGPLDADVYRFGVPTNYYESSLQHLIAEIERQLDV